MKLYENNPGQVIEVEELLENKKVILFGVPGAFTPGCSKTHLPGYIKDYDLIKMKGVDEIVCLSVNDPFVMEAWGKAHNADGKVRMLADTHGELAHHLGVVLDAEHILGNKRMKRFSLLAINGVVQAFNIEPDGTGLTCSLSDHIL